MSGNTSLTFPSGCSVESPLERLLTFSREEFEYYDAVQSRDPNRIEPLDVLATVAVNSFLNNAAVIRGVHRGLAAACDPLLPTIPEDADLLTWNPAIDAVRELLEAAISVKGVLVPVATKVLHRKRPRLIPMLDNVVLAYYLSAPERRPLLGRSQDKRHAASVGIEVLRLFRDDLRGCIDEIEILQRQLEAAGYPLSPVRIQEVLIWTEVEAQGYYRARAEP